MTGKSLRRTLLSGAALLLIAASPVLATPTMSTVAARSFENDIVFFALTDRFENGDPGNDTGGIAGGPERSGFDPKRNNFYHGGDLKGVLNRLDYIAGLGATAIWLTPVFKNQAVNTDARWGVGTGYHGYAIVDFTDIDPHLGTKADLKTLVEAAHARGIKIILDIVVNHTADVIRYRECPARTPCSYRSRADYPFTRRGGIAGSPINAGFLDDGAAHQNGANFARLTQPDYAYTPFVPTEQEHVKRPEWLNDPIYYHNRGETTFSGESSQSGDFAGLDDLMTENPRVVDGFVEIYSRWIKDFHIDGYRIDSAKHVNPELWQAFVPRIMAVAREEGLPNFAMFGEATETEPGQIARHTRVDRLPEMLDFAFQRTAEQVIGGKAPPQLLARLFEQDSLYEGDAARRLPIFLDNHDLGRFAYRLRKANPNIDDDELLKRVELGHALLLFSRGVPVLYYGDEQGFVGHGDDNASREDMFVSATPDYLDQGLLGTARTHASDTHDSTHPLYRAIAAMAAIRTRYAVLRQGEQVVRLAPDTPGVYAMSRLDRVTGEEILFAMNPTLAPIAAQTQVGSTNNRWSALHGQCATTSSAPGSLHVVVPALGWIACRAIIAIPK